MKEGEMQRLFGLRIIVYDGAYKVSTTTTYFVPNNYVLIFPEFDSSWISMVNGSNLIPFGDEDLQEVFGMAMYAENWKDPIGKRLYLKYTRLPVLKVPNAVIYAKVA